MRKKLIIWMFNTSLGFYVKWFKRNQTPWQVTSRNLSTYPKESFGYKLGGFLTENNFELIPKVERHDAYHVLTQYGTNVEDEIALQYLCMANGKRSVYMAGVILLGSLVLPEYYKYYYNSFKIGRAANTFHSLDFERLLTAEYQEMHDAIFSKSLQTYMKTELAALRGSYLPNDHVNTYKHADI